MAESDLDDLDADPGTGTDDTRLQLALDRFKLSSEAETDQRQAELDDLEFIDEEKQWDEDIRRDRGQQVLPGGVIVAASPCLVLSLLRQPLQQMANQRRQARLQLQFAPKGNGASREVAEVYEDLARAIQVDSRADIARNWAADRADKCGRGFYRILTAYANDGDKDLDIIYKRIPNQFSVYLDPFAQEPDWSDGEFAFITEDVPLRRFKREYGRKGTDGKPLSSLAALSDDDLRGIGDEYPEWIKTSDATSATIRVAEYFTVEMDADGGNRTVRWHKMTCKEFIEEQPWDGRYIPIVPVIGIETNVNGRRRWVGVVRPAKDAQRSYNWMRSEQTAVIGSASKAPWVAAEGQVEGYEDMWKTTNIRRYPVLFYKETTLSGRQANPPFRDIAEPAIQAITLAAHEAKADVQTITGFHAPALGENERDRSGKAVLALQKQAEIGASGYLDNLVSVSMAYEGKILRDLIPKIYDRPGRIIAAIGADDQRRSVMLGVPYVTEGNTPQPAQPGQPGAKPPINLAEGEYTVQPTVGKAHSTRREEAVAMVGEVLQAAPQLTPLLADILVDNMDIPGGKQMADRLKKMLPPQLQGENGQNPELQLMQVKQQAQQMSQMLDLMTKELEAKTKIIETETVKSQAELQRTRIDNDTKIKIAEIQSQTQFGVAEIKAALEDYKLRIGHIETILGHQAQAEQLHQQQAHETAMRGADVEVETGQAAQDREQELALTGAQQAHERTMAEQQAAQQPSEA